MKARLLAICALAAILAGCVIYTFPDLGPWDFDSATSVASPFSTSALNPWSIQSSGGYGGSKCLKSATPLTSGQTSTLTLTYEDGLDDDKDLHFYVKMSGEGTLTLKINNINAKTYNASAYEYGEEVDVWDSSLYSSSGTNTFIWTFTSQGGTSSYAIIDEIKIDG